jgi:hypothetical protein
MHPGQALGRLDEPARVAHDERPRRERRLDGGVAERFAHPRRDHRDVRRLEGGPDVLPEAQETHARTQAGPFRRLVELVGEPLVAREHRSQEVDLDVEAVAKELARRCDDEVGPLPRREPSEVGEAHGSTGERVARGPHRLGPTDTVVHHPGALGERREGARHHRPAELAVGDDRVRARSGSVERSQDEA